MKPEADCPVCHVPRTNGCYCYCDDVREYENQKRKDMKILERELREEARQEKEIAAIEQEDAEDRQRKWEEVCAPIRKDIEEANWY